MLYDSGGDVRQTRKSVINTDNEEEEIASADEESYVSEDEVHTIRSVLGAEFPSAVEYPPLPEDGGGTLKYLLLQQRAGTIPSVAVPDSSVPI